ncbi:MAG: type II toxin-antitoxin system VapC family toxin [Chloroflexota bacterium]
MRVVVVRRHDPSLAAAQEVVVLDASAAMALLAGDEAWLSRWGAWTEADVMMLAPGHFGVETTARGLAGLLGAIELAERHRLTVYDALYLDLALDVDGELATLDRDLARAAADEGVPVVG